MRIVLFAAIAAGFLSLSGSLAAQGKKGEPSTTIQEIGGRTLEEWIGDLKGKDNSKRENALRTILLFGPDRAYAAVPVIIDLLKKHNPLGPKLDTSVRTNGCVALGVILGGYKGANTKDIKEAVTVLLRYTGDTQEIVKYRAIQALGRIGPDAREASKALITASKDISTWELRHAAVEALGRIAQDKAKGPPVEVLHALFDRLEDMTASQVRLAAIQSLTWLGAPPDIVTKVALLKALDDVAQKDPEPTVATWAHMAFMSAAHETDTKRLEVISRFLKHKEVGARIQAAQALGTMGSDAKSTIPALIGTLRDPEPLVAGWAIWALGRMEKSALGALGPLQVIAKDAKQPEPLRKAAEEAIDIITGKKKAE